MQIDGVNTNMSGQMNRQNSQVPTRKNSSDPQKKEQEELLEKVRNKGANEVRYGDRVVLSKESEMWQEKKNINSAPSTDSKDGLKSIFAPIAEFLHKLWDDPEGKMRMEEQEAKEEKQVQTSKAQEKKTDIIIEEKIDRPEKAEKVPPFIIVEERKERPVSLWQRFKQRVNDLSESMAGHFPFAQTGSFQAKEEKNKEDLRRRSRYRGENEDTDCIVTDDSYLMDSYDQKGGYSKLSADRQVKH